MFPTWTILIYLDMDIIGRIKDQISLPTTDTQIVFKGKRYSILSAAFDYDSHVYSIKVTKV